MTFWVREHLSHLFSNLFPGVSSGGSQCCHKLRAFLAASKSKTQPVWFARARVTEAWSHLGIQCRLYWSLNCKSLLITRSLKQSLFFRNSSNKQKWKDQLFYVQLLRFMTGWDKLQGKKDFSYHDTFYSLCVTWQDADIMFSLEGTSNLVCSPYFPSDWAARAQLLGEIRLVFSNGKCDPPRAGISEMLVVSLATITSLFAFFIWWEGSREKR